MTHTNQAPADDTGQPSSHGVLGVLGTFAILLLVVGLLVLFGGVTIAVGVAAVRDQHHEFRSRHGSQVAVYDGIDAVCQGVGLIAFGVMLLVAGVAMVRGAALGQLDAKLPTTPTWTGSLLGWLAFLCLTVAAFSFYPPWRLASAAFFGTLVTLSAFVFWLSRKKQLRWGRRLKLVPFLLTAAQIAQPLLP